MHLISYSEIFNICKPCGVCDDDCLVDGTNKVLIYYRTKMWVLLHLQESSKSIQIEAFHVFKVWFIHCDLLTFRGSGTLDSCY